MSPKQLFSQLHEKISATFRAVSFKLYERMPGEQATYLYWLLGATALGGVVDASSATAALLALGKVVGDLGMGALGGLLDDFRNKKDEDERIRLLRETASDSAEVRDALDLLLKKTNALNTAQAAYQQEHPDKAEQQQFTTAMQQALAAAGSSLKISKSRIKGKAVAIGHKAKAKNISAKRGGVAVNKIEAKNVLIKTTTRESANTRAEATARKNYLESMRNACNLLPLAALADDRDPQRGAAMSLSQVYIDLNTTSFTDRATRGPKRKAIGHAFPHEREQTPLTALEVALQHPNLVLLGEPGSGKSSFTNHLLYLCASALLHQQKNLLPEKWPSKQTLPVRIVLRELAVDLAQAEAETCLQLSAEERDRKLLDLVFAHLKTRLQELNVAGFNDDLQTHLRSGACLFVLDGLDEVAVTQRPLLRSAITALRERLGPNRYIVTCRTRSWDDQHPLPAFHTSTLAHFTDEQVEQFVQYWYGALQQAGQFTPTEMQRRIDSMLRAIGTLEKDLVANPLLLTTMAVVHYNDTELPRERVRLYKRAAEVLLKRWQMHRAGQAGVLESLGIGDSVLYPALYELAHKAHEAAKDKTAADLPHEAAHKILRRHFAGLDDPFEKATAFLKYIDQTAGLLHGKGGVEDAVYTFPHRTFQEYFAGVYLTKARGRFEDALRLKLAEGDYWQVAARLGLENLLHNEHTRERACDAAYALCPEAPANEAEWRGVLWSGLFAVEIGKAQIKADREGERYLAHVTNNLIKLLEGNLLPHRERAEAGFVLGKLGDTRPGVCSFPLAWVELPGGRFMMGDETWSPSHEVELAPFKISRYPVTNAQFAAFMQAGGYEEKQWWSEESWKARQKEKWEQPDYWNDARFNLPNQPVVGVSWFEAEAFCNWCSAEGIAQRAEGKEQSTSVRLPTEAEWEYAARGKAGRIFSWGDKEPSAELANCEQNVGRTTAVGSYPHGATPEGLCDLTGNVWEWCRDWYDRAYYKTCEQKGLATNPQGPAKGSARVLRGGSWNSNPYSLRCANRLNSEPTGRSGGIGFRCSQDVR